MKLALSTLVLIAVGVAALSEDVDVAWENFKLVHEKQYRNLLEERVRKAIFVDNFNKIAEHNELFGQGLVKYTLKINKYSDMSTEEFKKTMNGYKKSKAAVSDVEVIEFVPSGNVEIPDKFDWREKGAVTPVKDQGRCGSCWTFSATGALEGQYFLKTGKLASISEQNLIDCSKEHNNEGCAGGDMYPSFIYIHNNDGIDSEDSYPYEGVDKVCRYKVSGNVTSTKGYGTIENGNEEHLKAAIATIGPIAVGIDASQVQFHFYDSGIYYNQKCSNGAKDPENELDHAVLAVGYGTEDGEDYWLIKNSWGTSWGMNGYIKMARNRDNNCGVAAFASFPINY